MKKTSRGIVVLALILSLVMPMSAFATTTELTADSTQAGKSLAGVYKTNYNDIAFQYSISEDATHTVTFKTNLTAAKLQAAVDEGKIDFEFKREKDRPYLDPELYPYAEDGRKISEWVDKEGNQTIRPVEYKVKGSKLTVKFETSGTEYYYSGDAEAKEDGYSKIYSIDHSNDGVWQDKCGYFDFNLMVNNKKAGSVHSKIVPYDSYRTPYELYDDLEAMKNADVKGRYVEVGSIGQTSIDGYDIPYIIVASSKKDVERWQTYTEKSEADPTQAIIDLKDGKYDDMAVPVYLSNCHTNENSAVNGIVNFAEYLIWGESEYSTKGGKVTLNTLESYTEEGKALLEKEKSEVFKTSISDLYDPFCDELGRLRGEYGDIVDTEAWVQYGYSGPMTEEMWDKYYVRGTDEFTVSELLDDVFFIIVPTMNMEGYVQQTRATGVGFDPNRDYANQTMYEDRNAMAFMSDWNPMAYAELHGRVEGYSVEPCGAPHNPNIEYDIVVEQFFEAGEAIGKAMVANNERFNSYELCGRDYIELDADSPTGTQWGQPWDDLSTNFGSQFPVFYGTVGITWEQPAYDDITAEQSIPAGCYGLGRYVQENKLTLLVNQATLFERGVKNSNDTKLVAEYYVNQYDEAYAQQDIMRPLFDEPGQNGNFYPECYIIPLDKENQKNIQDAAEAILWLARNGCEYMIAKEAFEYDGVTYPKGTAVVSMYQAKRSLVNANFGPGTFVQVWKGLYSEAFSQFSDARGFDQITVAEPAAYKAIDAACKDGYDYEGTLEYFADYAAQFSGEKYADVIISNASEDTAGAVNALLKAGKTVGMITEGEYMGDFICSYVDYLTTVADDYIVSVTGVYGNEIKATVIEESPTVYVVGGDAPGTAGNTELKGGNQYCFDVYALKQMGFDTTSKVSKADAVVGNGFGANSEDANAMTAVKAGTPYMVWGRGAGKLDDIVSGVKVASLSTGTDALMYVEYPTKSLLNANYVLDGDNQNYQYGTAYFTAMPAGAEVILKNVNKTPQVGCIYTDSAETMAEFKEYAVADVAFEYKTDALDVVAFANSLVHKGHPQDEFKYIANFLFSRSLGDAQYEGEAAGEGLTKDEIKALLADVDPAARSERTSKKNIKVTVKLDGAEKEILDQIEAAGYNVKYNFYRSTKKASRYDSKVIKDGTSFTNTSGKKDTMYYYKIRVQVYDEDDKLVARTALSQCKYANRRWTK